MMCNSQDFFTKIWTFWQMTKCWSKSTKIAIFKSFCQTDFLNSLLILNELSNRYQIGLKLKQICSNFKKYQEGNISVIVFYITHEGNWCFDWNFDQELIKRSRNHLRYQMSISTQVVPKTTSKYLSFETNLVSVAQTV